MDHSVPVSNVYYGSFISSMYSADHVNGQLQTIIVDGDYDCIPDSDSLIVTLRYHGTYRQDDSMTLAMKRVGPLEWKGQSSSGQIFGLKVTEDDRMSLNGDYSSTNPLDEGTFTVHKHCFVLNSDGFRMT